MSHQHPAPTFVVTGGGRPSDEQAAAITVALTELSDQVGEVAATPATPAWAQATLREGVGGNAITAPHDLHTGGAPGRSWHRGGGS